MVLAAAEPKSTRLRVASVLILKMARKEGLDFRVKRVNQEVMVEACSGRRSGSSSLSGIGLDLYTSELRNSPAKSLSSTL